jgi:hypothetical protein
MGRHRGGKRDEVMVDPDLGQVTRNAGPVEDAKVGDVPERPTRHDGSQR